MTTFKERTAIKNVLGRYDTYIGDGDSYYGVVTFDPATGTFAKEHIGSTYSYGDFTPTEEATPDVLEQAKAAYGRIVREIRLDQLAEEARELRLGKHVAIQTGPRVRNRPQTGEGQIFWVGSVTNGYRFTQETKFGVRLTDGTRGFYYAHELTIVDVTDYIDYESVRAVDKHVAYHTARPDWHTAFNRRDKLVKQEPVDERDALIKWVEGK